MSRIRANLITNQTADGAPTVQNGLIISGISTFQDIDVDGHTNLDNLSVAGVSTFTGNIFATGTFKFSKNGSESFEFDSGGNLLLSTVTPRIQLNDTNSENDYQIMNGDGTFAIRDLDRSVSFYSVSSAGQQTFTGNVVLNNDLDVDGHTNLDNVSIAGVTTITGSGNALEIVGGLVRSRNTASARFVANNGSAEGYFGWSSGVLTVGQAAATLSLEATGSNHIQLKTNGSERLRINNLGAVMVGGTLQAGSNGGLNAEVTNSGSETTPLVLINQGTADGSGVILSHRGKDDAGNQEDYNYIRMVADDTGSGSEDGSIRFWTAGGGSLAQRARIDSSGFNITPMTNASRNAGVSTATGTIIYNSSSSTLQVYQGTRWDTLSNVAFEPTGGNATYTFGSYKVHAFTSNGNFVPNTAGTVDILIVAGGGGAGTPDRTNYNGAWNGGGGAGGVLYTTSVSVTAQTYSIVIGAGGARQANGDNSTALGLTAIGGGRGGGTTSAGSGNVNWNGAAGGSGGGGLGDRPGPMQGGAGTAGQGNAGANGTDPGGNPNYEQGGGGGGAGEAGDTDGIGYGGDGRDMSAQFGTTYGESGVFGGGGAGGQGTHNSGINYGGTGGGGNSGGGYQDNGYASEAGTANTGGGGGAGGNATGGAGGQPGGSGIVLIRYLT